MENKKVFTREDYLNKVCTHREYYAQFAKPYKSLMLHEHTVDEWKKLFDIDENLNNKPLSYFDSIWYNYKNDFCVINKTINGYHGCSKSDITCACKEAIRELIDEQEVKIGK